MKALFVHDPADRDATIPGGVQLCTREFLAVVQAAADDTHLLAVTPTRHPLWRLRRRLGLGAYLGYDPAAWRETVTQAMAATRPSHVFLNRSELSRLAPLFRQAESSPQVIVMSHGNQSGDNLYEIAGPGGRHRRGWARWQATRQLGRDLVAESEFRHTVLDAVCVMSPEEAVLERWLGARRTHWIPRMVVPHFLPSWQPHPGRVGYVGTLDHTPNRVALEALGEALRHEQLPAGFELRLIGGPDAAGRDLAQRYSFMTYLGRLDDEALADEAASWSLFLNPIFWLSRGASMKLGQALSWGIPLVTTLSGARGYRLPEGVIEPCGDSPTVFARCVLEQLADPHRLRHTQARIVASATEWPGTTVLGAELRQALG